MTRTGVVSVAPGFKTDDGTVDKIRRDLPKPYSLLSEDNETIHIETGI